VLTVGLLGASDDDSWALALARDSVVVTKDHDFAEWAIRRRPCPQIVWLRVGNLPNGALFDCLATAWPKIMIGLGDGALVVEAR
jgi:predicted nuclease of predicted toxin-antitoxin system